MSVKRKVCLICIDGWGVLPPSPGNSITIANPPVMNSFRDDGSVYSEFIWKEIDASGYGTFANTYPIYVYICVYMVVYE